MHLKSTYYNSFNLVLKVSIITIICNILLFLLKISSGIISNSNAMVSDAIHTLSDVFTTFIVIIGVKLSSKKADKEHQYGHERIECIASVLLAVMLFATGFWIGADTFKRILNWGQESLEIPGLFAVISSIVSIFVKEMMYWYTRNTALKINSPSMLADAWHHRSDALSSIGALVGIVGARVYFPLLDPIASVIISLCICKVAFDIFKDSINKLIDKSCDIKTLDSILSYLYGLNLPIKIDNIKTRLFGNKIYVDIEISIDGEEKLKDVHEVSVLIQEGLIREFSIIKYCWVYVNPL